MDAQPSVALSQHQLTDHDGVPLRKTVRGRYPAPLQIEGDRAHGLPGNHALGQLAQQRSLFRDENVFAINAFPAIGSFAMRLPGLCALLRFTPDAAAGLFDFVTTY